MFMDVSTFKCDFSWTESATPDLHLIIEILCTISVTYGNSYSYSWMNGVGIVFCVVHNTCTDDKVSSKYTVALILSQYGDVSLAKGGGRSFSYTYICEFSYKYGFYVPHVVYLSVSTSIYKIPARTHTHTAQVYIAAGYNPSIHTENIRSEWP